MHGLRCCWSKSYPDKFNFHLFFFSLQTKKIWQKLPSSSVSRCSNLQLKKPWFATVSERKKERKTWVDGECLRYMCKESTDRSPSPGTIPPFAPCDARFQPRQHLCSSGYRTREEVQVSSSRVRWWWLWKKAAFSFLDPSCAWQPSKRLPLRVFLCTVDDGLTMGFWHIVVSLHTVCLGGNILRADCSRDPPPNACLTIATRITEINSIRSIFLFLLAIKSYSINQLGQ